MIPKYSKSVALAWLLTLAMASAGNGANRVTVERFETNPLIAAASSPTLGNKINGPSVIQVPDWVKEPLGKYYLYFAHHKGKFIRLAYGDSIEGPWRIYEPGTIRLKEATPLEDHIASPDVHVDEEHQVIRMYFHGSHPGTNQRTVSAVSDDGISFEVFETVHGFSYFRVFQYEGVYYAVDSSGLLNRSEYPDHGWGRREELLIGPVSTSDVFGERDDVRMRHPAVYVRGDTLYLFYSRKSDAPERILMATVALQGGWDAWKASPPIEILRPEMDYEGVDYPNEPSGKGGAVGVQELRDPYVFEEDGQLYLFYSVAGEEGIAGARLKID